MNVQGNDARERTFHTFGGGKGSCGGTFLPIGS